MGRTFAVVEPVRVDTAVDDLDLLRGATQRDGRGAQVLAHRDEALAELEQEPVEPSSVMTSSLHRQIPSAEGDEHREPHPQLQEQGMERTLAEVGVDHAGPVA